MLALSLITNKKFLYFKNTVHEKKSCQTFLSKSKTFIFQEHSIMVIPNHVHRFQEKILSKQQLYGKKGLITDITVLTVEDVDALLCTARNSNAIYIKNIKSGVTF